ncbi:phage integrase [Desulfuromonas versatilis]|uniref:Phage integrase n=1 Tax=Desulfuromonas versatilis TaxID=2802975 RepID=A0ABN6DYW3_9BACT|nr:DUF3596 domain-containing protein [Desulfuromonas versatilis]BCR05313.1 phage integrase [Desulfuromonas versatilis]
MGGAWKQGKSELELPKGVTVRQHKHSASLQIYFSYRGVSCRETLKLEPTKQNIKYAANLRAEVLNRIEKETFKYSDYFPDSKRAKVFGHVVTNVTVGELLIDFIALSEKTKEASTVRGYKGVVKAHLRPLFGDVRVRDLTPQMIRSWISGLQLTGKTVRNILTPLRLVLEQAVNDDIIDKNPLDKVVLTQLLDKKTSQSKFEVDPLSLDEINLLLSKATGQVKNLFQFALFSGLRTSELMALQWGDIDWKKGEVKVQRAVVERMEKTTKTEAGVRSVVLLPPALEALKAQKPYTFLHSDFVFHHPKKGVPWLTDKQIRESAWKPLLKKCGIRYRNPYQTRHTYASFLISQGENLWWIATQMGHVNTEMILKHYGKWVPDSSKKNGYQMVTDWSNLGQNYTHTALKQNDG